MNISFKDITKDNFYKVIDLSVEKSQQSYVAPNMYSIAQSKIFDTLTPYAIYDDDTLIGFTLYGTEEDGNFWITRFMIDKNFQGKGYGKSIFPIILDRIKENIGVKEIYLSCNVDNPVAFLLYEKNGFIFTDKIKHNEKIYKLTLDDN